MQPKTDIEKQKQYDEHWDGFQASSIRNATILAVEFIRLREEHGQLTPQIILSEAAGRDSKLHPYFTWNDR
jgi:hypothetical protein